MAELPWCALANPRDLGTTRTKNGPGQYCPVWSSWRHLGIALALPVNFIVQARVCDRPIKVFSGQGLPAKLAVIGDPAACLIIPFSTYDGRLIGEKLWCLLRKPGHQGSRHQRIPLTHCDILVIGSLPGGWGRPGTGIGSVSTVTSDISRYSNSRIFFTTLQARCRYTHACKECGALHPSITCPHNQPRMPRPRSPLRPANSAPAQPRWPAGQRL